MKKLIAVVLTGLLFCSCIKEEPLNAECDIEKAWVSSDNPTALFANNSDSLVTVLSTDTAITFTVLGNADISALRVFFQTTPGATIYPANGSVQDFSRGGVTYTLTSEDGQYQRRYEVRFSPRNLSIPNTLELDFEHFRLNSNGNYYEWYEVLGGQEVPFWGTANAGYGLTNSTAQPNEYPTVPLAEGHSGYGIDLVTLSTGAFGTMVGRPLAGGNLFIGSFDLGPALTNTLKCTLFGYDFDKKPTHVSGYYKYAPGAVVTDSQGQEVAGATDAGVFTVIFYKNHDEAGNRIILYGDDFETSPFIVARAKINRINAASEWTRFDLDMVYEKEVDNEVLANWGYSFTISASSSVDASTYQGAVGSVLSLDEIRVICN